MPAAVTESRREAAVSTQTIVRFERGEALKQTTRDRLRDAFKTAGIEFIPENGGGPGVQLTRSAESK